MVSRAFNKANLSEPGRTKRTFSVLNGGFASNVRLFGEPGFDKFARRTKMAEKFVNYHDNNLANIAAATYYNNNISSNCDNSQHVQSPKRGLLNEN